MEEGHVTELNLGLNNLVGTLPNEIGELRFLRFLSLYGKGNSWQHGPPNRLMGPIPSTIGNLSSLELFYINGNEITLVPHEIGLLRDLKWLYLAGNRLTGLPAEIGNLASLEYLYLTDNQLSSLPREIGGLSTLTHLYLGHNQLVEIPPEIGQLASLTQLNLDRNLLTTLPDSMIFLGSLVELRIGRNPMPRIPPVVGRIPALETLTIREYEKDSIPPGLDVAQQIRELNIWGGISVWPLELFSLINLESLHISRNRLDHIPPELGNLVNLVELNLDGNPFTGPIPPELGNLSNLEELSLHFNHLSGSLPPELGNMKSLQTLAINNTDISGPIPPELGLLLNLRSLNLRGNNLGGVIPPELGMLVNLLTLSLKQNRLSGEIPAELGNLPILKDLWLNGNKLSGVIPAELGYLTDLVELNLRGNQLSGPIPPSLANLTGLKDWAANLDYNALYVEDPQLATALKEIFGDFELTQTVPPIKLRALEIAGTSVLLTWDPIAFEADAGRHEVFIGTDPGGPYEFAGRTKNKTDSSIRVGGLDVGTTYHLVVRTVTESHKLNPNRLISEFSHELKVMTGPVHDVYFPLLISGAESFTGFAVSNVASSDAMLEFNAFGFTGDQIPGTSNPSLATINGKAHLARLGSEIFGYAPQSEQRGWALLTADSSPLGRLFLIGGDEKLDGGPAFDLPARHFWFTRALVPASLWGGESGSALVALANPSLDKVSVEVTLWGDKHTPFVNTRAHLKTVRTIPPMGLLLETISTLFENHGFQSGDLAVEVKSGEGVIGFEVLESSGGHTIVGLNPSFDPGYTQLYSAQFATGPGISTSLKLVNTGNEACHMTIRAIGNDGSELAKPYQDEILSKDYFERDVNQIFDFSQAEVVGSISVTLDKRGVIGDVIIGERTGLHYASALSLQGRLFKEAIFSQVANTSQLFTGLALMNPQGEVADVTIEVFSSDGRSTGQASFKLLGGHRLSKLLFELVPETRNQVEGYFLVRSSQPLAGQQIFGDYRQTFFAAVPPKILGVYALAP